jgi:hypothetical protein
MRVSNVYSPMMEQRMVGHAADDLICGLLARLRTTLPLTDARFWASMKDRWA